DAPSPTHIHTLSLHDALPISYTHTFRNGGTYRYHDGLHPSLRGTVTVRGAAPQVTLATSAPIVKFGTQVTLTGTVSNKKAGETRSEEHTSELQSRFDLVCRLL